MHVDFDGGERDFPGAVELVAPDSDGVAVTSRVEVSLGADQRTTASIPFRLGQETSAISVRLVHDGGFEAASRTLYLGRDSSAGGYATALPATARLVVTYGAVADLPAALAHADKDVASGADVRSVLVKDVASLPTTWYGYESVDLVILSGADLKAYADANQLAPRIAALNRWVELGGRLVIFCGAESAPELLVDGGPLAPLVPARFSGEVTPIPEFGPIEVFSGAVNQLPKSDLRRFRVPRMVDLEPAARLLAEGPGALPLVIRARRQLGEITFVALDPEASPFAEWSDRAGLLRQTLEWPAPAVAGAPKRAYAGPTTVDLTNQLRSALDQQFTGVATASFALVAVLAIGYIALLGPGDFFFVQRVLKRMELTWLTFPLLVVATSAGAYALSYRMKGNELRVNQVEIVDVDVATGNARGTVWTHLFNPKVARYDLNLEPRFAGKNQAGDRRLEAGGAEQEGATDNANLAAHKSQASSLKPTVLASWLGVPGYGLGAMQGHRGEGSLFDPGYTIDDDLTRLEQLPIEQWSTKSLTARWTGRLPDTLEATLRAVGPDQLEGRITNRTGARLEDCVLMRGGWAYRLPPLAADAAVNVDESLSARTIKTTLTSIAAGDNTEVRTAADGSVLFDGLSTDVARLVKLMMFYESVGGSAYTAAPNRYQGFIDLSRLLKGDVAILLARAPAGAGSHWIQSEPRGSSPRSPRPLASEADRRWVYYRFVIPLDPSEKPTPAPVEPPKIYGPLPVPAS